MNNIPEEFYENGVFSDDYLWLRHINSCKQITFERKLLEIIAEKYNINHHNYKNKRLLLNAILDYWNEVFRINPEFKNKYEEHFEYQIDL